MKSLKELVNLDNIAEELDEKELEKIGQHILAGFNEDLNSASEWMQDVKKIMELASLKSTKKSTPLPDSANIKLPIITKAAYEYASRTYPEIVKDDKAVRTRVLGKDITGEKKKQAQRVEDFMNYQLLFQNTDWESGTDKLLTLLPIIGFICKKTYYDPIRTENRSDICDYNDLIINSKTRSLNDADRISHVIHLSLNDTIEYVRSGLYLEDPIKELLNQTADDQLRPSVDIIEQHCFLDLDDDDYQEPYIVSILKESGKIVRICARYSKDDIKYKNNKVQYIDAIQYFTDYHFLISPKGEFQSVGLGILLLYLNETSNTLLNQIVDAGSLANLQCGYVDSRAKMIDAGNSLHDPGELKKIKTANGMTVKDSVHMINFKEPSSVLFQTLGLIMDSARDLSSITDVMTGASGTDNTKTGAVLALQEEGRKMYNSVQKRVYRSQSAEFKKLFKLNQEYLDPKVYINVLDDELAIAKDDFNSENVNVIPVADPTLSSESSRVIKAQFLAGTMAFPGVRPEKITRRIYESTNIENPDELLLSEKELEQARQTPNPEIIKVQADIERSAQDVNAKHRELDIEEKRIQMELYKTQCECLKLKSDAILNIAKAESLEAGEQTQMYMKQLDMLSQNIENQMRMTEMYHERQIQGQQQEHERQTLDQERLNEQQNQALAPTSSNTGVE